MPFDTILVVDINEQRSSLIRKLEYNEDLKLLTVYFRKYYTDHLTYQNIPEKYFTELINARSIGSLYLDFIKPNFSLFNQRQMSDEKQRPPTKNLASDEKRYIDIRINVRDIKKEWMTEGEKGTYLDLVLHMLPDGKLDKYGNLGMITQKVPTKVYKEDNTAKGAILGNAAEIDWKGRASSEGQPGTEGHGISQEAMDDLPF